MKHLTTLLLTLLVSGSLWADEGKIPDLQSNSKNSIYLACEAGKKNKISFKPGSYNVNDLLENKIDLTLNKKGKRIIKKGFEYTLKYDKKFYKPMWLVGKIEIPIKYVDPLFDFVAIKIPDKSYDGKRTICTSSNRTLSDFGSFKDKPTYKDKFSDQCHIYEEKVSGNERRLYAWNKRDLGGDRTWAKNIDRETLIYKEYKKTRIIGVGATSSHENYKCYISNLDQINILEINYKDSLKPFEEEWQRLVSEYLLKQKVIEAKNKI